MGERKVPKLYKQYVLSVEKYSSQYGDDNSISYTALNLIGPPNPGFSRGIIDSWHLEHGYFPRSYGSWSEPPEVMADFPSTMPPSFPFQSQDYIEVTFQHPVFPKEMLLYETSHPGAVIRIFAYNSLAFDGDIPVTDPLLNSQALTCTGSWKLAWSEVPHKAPNRPRVHRVIFEEIFFATNHFRIEFYHRHLAHHYQLDAIALKGYRPSLAVLLSHFSFSASISPEEEEPPPLSPVHTGVHLFDIPDEVLVNIMSMVDLQSLCRAARVSRKFYDLCYDPHLYSCIDLQPYWFKVTGKTLDYLTPRCKHTLRKLSLNWCTNLDITSIIRFLKECGKELTSFRFSDFCLLTACKFTEDLFVMCPKLCEVELKNLMRETVVPDLHFFPAPGSGAVLPHLRWVDLYHSDVKDRDVLTIIKSSRSLEHLGLGSCYQILDPDEVLRQLGLYHPTIKSLDLWRQRCLTATGVFRLAEKCRELTHLDISWCLGIDASTGCLEQLFSRCTKLRKMALSAIRTLKESDLSFLAANCHHVERLDLMGILNVTADGVAQVLESCPNLRLIELTFCDSLDPQVLRDWRTRYPNVEIKHNLLKEQPPA